MPDLEPAIRQMLEATNSADEEAFVDGGGAVTFVLSGDRIGRMVITG
jgi:hypothetical protein